MLSLLVFQPVTSSDYSQSSTQPYLWLPAHRDAITWLLCYATAIGCQSNSVSSTSCVWWYVAACTATHHLTWRTWSRHRPLQLSDLLHPVQLQCHELYRRSETGPSRLLVHVHGTNFHCCFVVFIFLLLLNVNLRHFYTITLLIHIVRRPCCVSALISP